MLVTGSRTPTVKRPKRSAELESKWKGLAMGGMALASFTQIFGPLSAAPQVPYYMEEFDATLPRVI
jgi:hypothetical protein